MGTVPGRPGSMRVSAKTRSWEQAESLARKYEITAAGGDEIKEARTLPTVKEAVKGYLSDAEARGLAPATIQKLEHIFRKQLLAFADQHRIIFLRDVNVRNMTEWRSTWADKPLARKKKFERVVGFFWFCVRHGWLKDNPTATMGRVIAKHVPTDYFTADEYKRIIGATYRLGEDAERSWAPERRGIRIRALTELMRWSGLRIRDAVTLECSRLDGNKLLLYQAKTGIPVFVPLPPHVADLLRLIPLGLKPNPNYFFWSGNGLPKTFVANWQRAYRRLFKITDLASRTALQSVATAICSATLSQSKCCWPASPSIRFRSCWAMPASASPKSTTHRGCAVARTSSKRACSRRGNSGRGPLALKADPMGSSRALSDGYDS